MKPRHPLDPPQNPTETREEREGGQPPDPAPSAPPGPVNREVTSPSPAGPWRTLAVKVPTAAAFALEREALEGGRTVSTHLRGILLAHLSNGGAGASIKSGTDTNGSVSRAEPPTLEAAITTLGEVRKALESGLPPGQREEKARRLLEAWP